MRVFARNSPRCCWSRMIVKLPGVQNCDGTGDLKKELRGQKAVLVWDGLPAHKSKGMKEYLFEQRHWLTVERLPGYAPDLNPVETLWGNIKGQELANRCADDLAEVEAAVRSGMARVEDSSKLPFSFLKHAKLFF